MSLASALGWMGSEPGFRFPKLHVCMEKQAGGGGGESHAQSPHPPRKQETCWLPVSAAPPAPTSLHSLNTPPPLRVQPPSSTPSGAMAKFMSRLVHKQGVNSAGRQGGRRPEPLMWNEQSPLVCLPALAQPPFMDSSGILRLPPMMRTGLAGTASGQLPNACRPPPQNRKGLKLGGGGGGAAGPRRLEDLRTWQGWSFDPRVSALQIPPGRGEGEPPAEEQAWPGTGSAYLVERQREKRDRASILWFTTYMSHNSPEPGTPSRSPTWVAVVEPVKATSYSCC